MKHNECHSGYIHFNIQFAFFTLYYYIDRVILGIIYLAIRLIKSKLKKHSNLIKSAQESSEIIYADL